METKLNIRHKVYITISIIVMLFQPACGDTESGDDPKKSNQERDPVTNSNDDIQQLVSVTDTLNTRTDFFADELFPAIVLGMPNTDRAFKQVKKWGVTHVHRYGMGRSIEKDQSFFDRAEKYGFKVMSDLRAKYWLKENRDIDIFHKYITHFKEHSALGFWYLSDEPDNKGIKPNELKSLYQILKKETPDIPVANAHAWTEDWYKYGGVQDILFYDYYPVLGGTFPDNKLKAWTNFTENVFKRGNADNDLVVPILQIFNWKSFANDGQRKFRDYEIEKLRYPNTSELRYMIFSSIALGARGIALFSYARAQMVDPHWGDEVLVPVLKETKELVGEISNTEKQRVYSKKDKKVFLTRWSNENADFIILVNAMGDERKINLEIDTTIRNIKEYKPWGQSRKSINVSLSKKQLTIDKIKPWEIIIFKKI